MPGSVTAEGDAVRDRLGQAAGSTLWWHAARVGSASSVTCTGVLVAGAVRVGRGGEAGMGSLGSRPSLVL